MPFGHDLYGLISDFRHSYAKSLTPKIVREEARRRLPSSTVKSFASIGSPVVFLEQAHPLFDFVTASLHRSRNWYFHSHLRQFCHYVITSTLLDARI
jgi:hypothetical protein